MNLLNWLRCKLTPRSGFSTPTDAARLRGKRPKRTVPPATAAQEPERREENDPVGPLGLASRRLLIIGNRGGTHIGESFQHAARQLGVAVRLVENQLAYGGGRAWRSACWHLLGHRPATPARLERRVLAAVDGFGPDTLITTGISPVGGPTLTAVRKRGVRIVAYLTDDPWNPGLRCDRFLRSIPHYDLVLTPRRSNVHDLTLAGATRVRFLPFGYDPRFTTAGADEPPAPPCDVLFVGGADGDRAPLVSALVRGGFGVAVYGGYWDRYPGLRGVNRGTATPACLARATASAKVSLILVRRANRDGHVMRSFEAAAVGGCLLVEDTVEHRELFGPPGECVTYFHTPGQMVTEARRLVNAPAAERDRLSDAVRTRVTVTGRHTYADRLDAILSHVPTASRDSETASHWSLD